MGTGNPGATDGHAPRVCGRAVLDGAGPVRDADERALLAVLALEASADGSWSCAGVVDIARRALAGVLETELPTLLRAATALARCDAFDDVATALSAAAPDADAQCALDVVRAEALLREGELAQAAAALDRHSGPDSAALRARCALLRGDTEQAAAALAGCEPTAEWLLERARLRAATGALEEAWSDALAAGAGGAASNPAALEWRSQASVVALRLGRRDDAQRLAAAELELARRFGAPRAIGIAARAAGQARNDVALLAEAVAAHRQARASLELCSSLLELGAQVRRGGERREAREALREALDLAERHGAGALAARAREELSATGAKPRRAELTGPASLTASERRVALRAAAGRSNREIAGELFVTMRTVTTHLTHVYLKLGIERRDQLAAALGGTGARHPAQNGAAAPARARRAATPEGTAPMSREDADRALAARSNDARALAAAIALLGAPALADAGRVAGLEPRAVDSAWAELTQAAIVETRSGGTLALSDAALADAAVRQLAPGAAAHAHAQAAALLMARGDRLAAAQRLEHVAPVGDASVVAALREAAQDSARRGDHALAARILRRALAEPPSHEQRAEVLLELGAHERAVRDPHARLHLAEALELAPTTAARATGAALLADVQLHGGRHDEARATLEDAIAGTGTAPEPALLAPLESLRVCAALVGPAPPPATDRVSRRDVLAIAAGAAGRGLSSAERLARWSAGAREPRTSLTAADLASLTACPDGELVGGLTLARLVADDRVADATAAICVLAAAGHRLGSTACRLHALLWGSHLALRCGRVADALADAQAAMALAADADLATFAPLAGAFTANALLLRGDVAEAARIVDDADTRGCAGTVVGAYHGLASGRVRLAQGKRDEAVRALRGCGEVSAHRFTDQPNVAPWRSALALALADDHADEARRLVEEELALARASRRPRAVGVALHAQALLGAAGDRAATLRQSEALLAAAQAPLEHAAVLLDLGTPDRLELALSIALEAGATALVEQAVDRIASAP